MGRHSFKPKYQSSTGLHVVALFEGAKGLLVLLVGFGLLTLVHRDVHEAAVELVRHLHVNPARHYPTIFVDLAGRVTDAQLWAAALGAAMYAIIRLIEAVGLWMHRRWAEWFGALTGGMYIPAEVYEVLQGADWPKLTVLLINVGVVLYLLRVLLLSRRDR